MEDTTKSIRQSGQRLSFGVEAEFLIPWRFDDETDPHDDVPNLSPLFRIPRRRREEIRRSQDPKRFVSDLILEHTQRTLRNWGLFPRLSKGSRPVPRYCFWEVEGDSTVVEDTDEKYRTQLTTSISLQQWVDIELQSPAEFESPLAFKAISYAYNVFKKTYRCYTNPSCSTHVHVGLGREIMDLTMMRRVATLAYAVDPLLFTLQNPDRQVNGWCQPIRQYSRLATNDTDPPYHAKPFATGILCRRYLGKEVRHGEQPISWRLLNSSPENIRPFRLTRQPNHFEPFLSGSRAYSAPDPTADSHSPSTKWESAPIRKRKLPKMKFPRPSEERLGELVDELIASGVYGISSIAREKSSRGRSKGNVGVFDAARRIYEARSSCAIERLLGTEGNSSINFIAYTCSRLQDTKPRPTIEFRLGSGGLDDWVTWWARICIGVVRFAIQSSASDLLRVLHNCDTAATQDGQYDVLDFLEDIGLFAEAEAAEKRIAKKKDAWKVEFV